MAGERPEWAAVEREQRVTAVELFFDLVFVFAITQVTGFVYTTPAGQSCSKRSRS